MNSLIKDVTSNMEKYEFGIALQKVYEFIWEEFCDWFIELVKPRLYDKDALGRRESLFVLNKVLATSLKLLHPFMPFVTEEIYSNLITDDKSIMISDWPLYSDEDNYADEENKMSEIMVAIKGIRNIRAEMGVPPSRKAKAVFVVSEEKLICIYETGKAFFEKLAFCSDIEITTSKENIDKNYVSAVVKGCEIYIPLGDLIDIEKEIERLNTEKEKLELELDRVRKKLSNVGFVAKAPKQVVEAEKEKQGKYEEMYDKVLSRIKSLT